MAVSTPKNYYDVILLGWAGGELSSITLRYRQTHLNFERGALQREIFKIATITANV